MKQEGGGGGQKQRKSVWVRFILACYIVTLLICFAPRSQSNVEIDIKQKYCCYV